MSKLANYKKSIAAFLTAAVTSIGALLSLGILGDAQSHGLTVALVLATPFLTWLGVVVAPPNVPPK